MSVNVSSDQNLEANLIHHEAIESSSSSVPQIKNYKRWFRLSIYVFFVLFFQPLATILGRLYYENGGESTYVVTLLSLVGFPLLLTNQTTEVNRYKLQSVPFLHIASAYMCTGLLVSANAYLYAIGLLYLPVSTYSLISASQLACWNEKFYKDGESG
ncbi:hypothetical protein YC2023_099987 [Brassica napus]